MITVDAAMSYVGVHLGTGGRAVVVAAETDPEALQSATTEGKSIFISNKFQHGEKQRPEPYIAIEL